MSNVTWGGKRVDRMTKAELLEAVERLAAAYRKARSARGKLPPNMSVRAYLLMKKGDFPDAPRAD